MSTSRLSNYKENSVRAGTMSVLFIVVSPEPSTMPCIQEFDNCLVNEMWKGFNDHKAPSFISKDQVIK